jgi:two-component system sensor histidine kinase QseC
LILAGALLQWQIRRALIAELDASVLATFRTMEIPVEQRSGLIRIDLSDTDSSQLRDPNSSVIFLLRTVAGQEVGRSASLGAIDLPLSYGSSASPVFFNSQLPNGRIIRCATIRFTPPYQDDVIRPPRLDAILTVGVDRASADRQLTAIDKSLWLIGVISLAGLGVLVYFGVRGGLVPLSRLGSTVATVDAGSLATRFPVKAIPLELQPIVVRLNELFCRLELAFARERRFTRAAAHELRTPLAELRALAEVNLTTPGSVVEAEQSWQDTLATVIRMQSLASRLLDLSRTENLACALQAERVPMEQAIAAAWEPWQKRATARQIERQIALSPKLEAEVDPVVLGIVLGNFLGNAVEHSRESTVVRIEGTKTGNDICLRFENETTELAAVELPNIFKRSWKKARADTAEELHGFGLALAVEFAALIGGRVIAEMTRTGFVNFTLWLPAADASGRTEASNEISPAV